MNVIQCLDRLANGELANTSFTTTDQIADNKVHFIVSLINEALLRLYSRFVLKTDSVFVEMNELRTVYELTKDHIITKAINDKFDPEFYPCVGDYDKYIFSPTGHPFTENIIKIFSVVRDDGYTYPLNNPELEDSVFTLAHNVIQIPLPIKNASLAVEYQASHPLISTDNLDIEIELPKAFYGAFFAYIAKLAYSSLQSENAGVQAQKYNAIYSNLLEELVTFDLGNSSHSNAIKKFYLNGWC